MKVSIEVSMGTELRDFMKVERPGVGDPMTGAILSQLKHNNKLSYGS